MAMGKNYAAIPNDWDGESTEVWMVCVPASEMWRIAFRNAVRMLTRGRYWDGETGTITQAQAIGWSVYRDMSTCNEIVDALNGISSAIGNIQTSMSVQVPCCDYTPAEPVDDTVFPTLPNPENGEPSQEDIPAWSTPESYSNDVCDAINKVLGLLYNYTIKLQELSNWWLVAGVVAGILLELLPTGVTQAVGGAVLASAAAAIVASVAYKGAIDAMVTVLQAGLEDEEFISDLSCGVVSAIDFTTAVRSVVVGWVTKIRDILVDGGMPQFLADGITMWLAANEVVLALVMDFIEDKTRAYPDPPSWLRTDCTCSCGELEPVGVVSANDPNSNIQQFASVVDGNRVTISGFVPDTAGGNIRLARVTVIPPSETEIWAGYMIEARGSVGAPGLISMWGVADDGVSSSGLQSGIRSVKDCHADDALLMAEYYGDCEPIENFADLDGQVISAGSQFSVQYSDIPNSGYFFNITLTIRGRYG